ncbi:hypothetical protein XELAEV_18002801mg [Xenopus laevis]|nr:hypothetical protein XELAEV_18002801mg [Xenopus laevis]
MFNQQQQQFHQLMQLQHLLQQQQQHPAQHHPTPRSIPAPVQHQQPQQMLNIRGAAPARLINTHPMFQRALLMQHMQGNLRGLSMAAPTMSPFFTAAARQSILGTPPMGVTVKAPRVGFPGLPFQQPQRMYLKDHHRTYDRKKDGEQGVASHVKNEDEKQSEKGEIDLPPAASEADEESENLTECSVTDPSEPSAKRARSSEEGAGECHFRAGELLEDRERGGERSVESQPPEGISGGRALKVTIQQRSESRTISTTDLVPSHTDRECTGQTGPRFCCYICKSNFQSLQRYSTTKNAMNAAEASTSCSPKPESLEGVEAGASIGSENTEWAEQMATIPDSLQAENGQGESDMANKEGVALVAEESGANKSVGGLQEPENIPAQGEKELINNEDSGAVAFQEEAAPFSSCHRLYQHKPR